MLSSHKQVEQVRRTRTVEGLAMTGRFGNTPSC